MTAQLLGRRARSAWFDLGVAAVVAAFTVMTPTGVHPSPPRWVGYAMAAALLARRRWPLSVMAAVSALALAQVLVQPDGVAVLYDVAVLIAMYSAVKYGRTLRDCFLALAPVTAGIAIEVWRGPAPGYGWMAALWYVSVCGGVWAVGYTMRTRRQYIASLEERAATAEREREHLARIAVANERAAIARELHDIVAHSLAVMVVQADGAAYTLDSDADAARGAIRQVATTGREALEDMRRLVHVLRDGGEAGAAPTTGGAAGQDPPDRRRITLDQVSTLAERARSAGLAVTLTVADAATGVPPAVHLAAYRIVQESLTNVLRHAGHGAAVTVELGYDEQTLTIEVVDDGGGRLAATPRHGGHGVIGMRERVAAHGGRFSAGPRVGSGWRVHATVPAAGPGGAPWPVAGTPRLRETAP